MKNYLCVFLFGFLAFICGTAKADEIQKYKAVNFPLSQESEGIGFDDLSFAPGIRKVLIPGGRTGNLFLIDPETHKISSISGFSQKSDYHGGHGDSITSADEGDGFLFTADRTSKTIFVIDPKLGKIIGSAKISGGPDYVRYVPFAHEVWVTEPREEKIEIFSFDPGKTTLLSSGFVQVSGGPESLAISNSKLLAYTHLWHGQTMVIDIKSRKVTAQWPNGCKGSRGIAMDDQNDLLFVGCLEGAAVALDTKTGSILSEKSTGGGVDIISYNSKLSHLYVPSRENNTLNIFKASNKGDLSLFKEVEIISNSQGTVADDNNGVWVGDPDHGQLLFYKDGTV